MKPGLRAAAGPIGVLVLVAALASVWNERCNAPAVEWATVVATAEGGDADEAARLAMAWYGNDPDERHGLTADELHEWVRLSPQTAGLPPVRFASRDGLPPDLAREHWAAMAALGHGVDVVGLRDGTSGHGAEQRGLLLCVFGAGDVPATLDGSEAAAAGSDGVDVELDDAELARARAALASAAGAAPDAAIWRALGDVRADAPRRFAATTASVLREVGHVEAAQLWTRRLESLDAMTVGPSRCVRAAGW